MREIRVQLNDVSGICQSKRSCRIKMIADDLLIGAGHDVVVEDPHAAFSMRPW
jgi:hypothetical protein